jgi:hypothetical protein
MKIELTMTELMLIVDMIKNGTEQDNEGDDFCLMQEFLDGPDTKHKVHQVQRNDGQNHQIEMRTPPAYGALGFSKRQATALINGVFFHIK